MNPALMLLMRAKTAVSNALASDTFNRANGALGTTDGPEQLTWQGITNIAIVSNAAKPSANEGRAVVDVGTADQKVSVTLLTTNPCGVVLRANTTASDYYKVHYLYGRWYLLRCVNSVATTAGSTAYAAPASGDVLTVTATTGASSVDVTVEVNGSEVYAASDATATRLSGTCAGIIGNANTILDNFKVEAP